MNRDKIIDYLIKQIDNYKEYECMPENESGYEHIPRHSMEKIVDGLIPMVKSMVKKQNSDVTFNLFDTTATKIKYPIGGFAKGNYSCICKDCNERFTGDKCSYQCEHCAINAINESHAKISKELFDLKEALKKIQFNNTLINEILGKQNGSFK